MFYRYYIGPQVAGCAYHIAIAHYSCLVLLLMAKQPGYMYDVFGVGQAVIEYLHKPVPTESQDGSSGAAAVAPGEVSFQEVSVLLHC